MLHEEKKDEQTPERKSNVPKTIAVIAAALVLVGILVALIAVPEYLKKERQQENNYNGFQFTPDEAGHWWVNLEVQGQPYVFPFYYHPRDVEDVALEQDLKEKFFALRAARGRIFITLDPDSTDNRIVVAGVEISKITGTRFAIYNLTTSSAFTKAPTNQTVNTGTPIVTCAQSSPDVMVIWLRTGDKNLVYSQGNCVLVEGKTYEDLIRAANRLDYHLLGIME